MQLLNKLFFGIQMKWWKVIVFAVVTGVYTGIVMMIPAFAETSIQCIGVTMEAWVFFAVIICTNCEKPLECSLKVFVFFLISQPLVYLTMWPQYGYFPWNYYQYWFYWTLITPFCALVVWYVRKQNIGSALCVFIICIPVLTTGVSYVNLLLDNPPSYLLTVLFCAATVVIYVMVLLKRARERIIAGMLALGCCVGLSAVLLFGDPQSISGEFCDNANLCTFEVADENIVVVENSADNEDSYTLYAKGYGTTQLTITFPDGHKELYDVKVKRSGGIEVTAAD